MAQEPSQSQTKSKKKDNDKILKQIHKSHPEFELTYDMMLGIRHAVSTSEASIASATPRDLPDDYDSSDDDESQLESDFTTHIRYRFPSSGSTTTPAHMMRDFKFKDYCPQIFKQLREWFGISQAEYLVSLCGDFAFLEFISNSKSGQFFFFSHNQKYMIKTMTRAESLLLRKILPAYFRYVSRQPDTLLTKFFGMHRVKPHKRNAIYFLIMSNVFFSDVEIHVQYDLKGSTFGRRTPQNEKDKGCILKDLDFVDEGQEIVVGSKQARLFHEQLRKDCEFLRKLKIMDYSLLVGIHYRDRAASISSPLPLTQISENHATEFEADHLRSEEVADEKEREPPMTHVEAERESRVSEIPFEDDDEDDEGDDEGDDEDDGDGDDLHQPDLRTTRSAPDVGDSSRKRSSLSASRSFHFSESLPHGRGMPPSPRSPPRARRPSGFKPTYRSSAVPDTIQLMIPDLVTPSMRAEAKPVELQRQGTWIRTDITEHENPFTLEHGGMCFEDENGNKGNEIYFTGLIDILQKYNKRKKVENFFKSLSHDPMTISAAPPEVYARRLCDFMKDKVV